MRGRQTVEIIPLRLEEADRVQIFTLEIDPVEIVDFVGPEAIEIVGKIPMSKLGAVDDVAEVASGSVIVRYPGLGVHKIAFP